VTLGLSRDLAGAGVAVNSLWPETAIATAAVGNLLGGEAALRHARRPRSSPTPPRDSCARGADLHRQFLHRRGRAARGGRQGFQVLCRRSSVDACSTFFSTRHSAKA